VRFGNDVIVWSGNHFGHDVAIDDHCWLSSHIVASGGVRVGSHSFIGVNVTIRDGVRIGSRCIIGAGAILLKDAADGEVYVARQTELYRLDSQAFERMMEISRD
jgi:acyl-[acyl carrier protein]--UDP-N-acetylglucosamine O-acyltransferase